MAFSQRLGLAAQLVEARLETDRARLERELP